MRKTFGSRLLPFAATALALGWLFATPARVHAQTQGQNTVYSGTSSKIGSWAFIDASVVAGTSSGTDLCAKINAALLAIPTTTTAAVIDARGVTNLTCPSGDTPWKYGNTVTTPATILLPAGTISSSNIWLLPNGTKIIGQGPGVTTIQAAVKFSPMIQMGSSTLCPSSICNGISVEDLTLDAQGNNMNGISNGNAQELSYVKRVAFYQFQGTGLVITSGASNSGPYTDLTFSMGSKTPVTGTVCVSLRASTRGIHGLTCTNTTSTIPSAAVLLDAPNNSIEDVTVRGFTDGVKIGANLNAQDNVLVNVAGAAVSGGSNNVTNVVHITNTSTVTDLSILGVGNGGNSSSKTIKDDVTSTTLSDATVGIYAIGESVTAGSSSIGFSRFTTSPNVPTWIIQNTAGSPTGSCTIGSLYSNTAGGSGSTWFVCTPKGTHSCGTLTPCWTDIE